MLAQARRLHQVIQRQGKPAATAQ